MKKSLEDTQQIPKQKTKETGFNSDEKKVIIKEELIPSNREDKNSKLNNILIETTGKGWKIAFFTLLISIFLFFIIGWFTLYATFVAPYKNNSYERQDVTEKNEDITFITSFSKEQFARLINALAVPSGVNYSLEVKDDIKISSTFKVFGLNVPAELYGLPEAIEDGNIVIKINKFKIAGLSLPLSWVLGAFADVVPKKVPLLVIPKEEKIILLLDKVKLKNGISIKANIVDLKKNLLEFKLNLPTEAFKNIDSWNEKN